MPKTTNHPFASDEELIRNMKDQMLIALLKRVSVNNVFNMPVAELDNTGQDMLGMSASPDGKTLIFKLSKKS